MGPSSHHDATRPRPIIPSARPPCLNRVTRRNLIERATLRRTTSSNDVHEHSSRSHAFLTLHLERRTAEAGVEQRQTTRFHLVDLAGSENFDCKESDVGINFGLLALGKVRGGDAARCQQHAWRTHTRMHARAHARAHHTQRALADKPSGPRLARSHAYTHALMTAWLSMTVVRC